MAGKIITALTAASGGELVATSVIPGMEAVSGTQARKFTITQIGTILNVATLGANTFTGQQLFPNGSAANVAIGHVGDVGTGIRFSTQEVIFGSNGFTSAMLDTSRLRLTSTSTFNWSSGADPSATGPDTGLERQAAGVVRCNTGEKNSGGGAIATGDPTSGDGPAWKLGAKKSAAVTIDTGNYLEVSVAGVTYKVAINT